MSQSDADKAIEVWNRDEELDEMYSSLFREFLTYMMEDAAQHRRPTRTCCSWQRTSSGSATTRPTSPKTCTLLVHGTPLTEARPKGDKSSLEFIGGDPAGDRSPMAR